MKYFLAMANGGSIGGVLKYGLVDNPDIRAVSICVAIGLFSRWARAVLADYSGEG